MTLQTLLSGCKQQDYRGIAKLWNKKQPEWEKPLDIDKAAEGIQNFCEMLTTLDAAPSTDVLIALNCFEDGEKQVSAELFRSEKFHQKMKESAGKMPPAFSLNDDREKLIEVYHKTREWTPETYGYEFSEWEEILGAEVYQENYDSVGKIEFLSEVLYELSFNGFTREAQEERREELKESIREMEELKNLPEEEQKKHYHTWEELKEEFGIEDIRTEQEAEEDDRLMLLDCVLTRIAWIRELQRLAEVL